MKVSALTGVAGVMAVGFALAMAAAPRTAHAIAFDGSCQTDIAGAINTTAGSSIVNASQFDKPCGNAIADNMESVITTKFSGARADIGNWNVMGTPYGQFSQSLFNGASSATFKLINASNTHAFGWSESDGSNQNAIFTDTQSSSAGDSETFTIPLGVDPFLFYASNGDGAIQEGITFFTDSLLNDNLGVDDFVHFVILEGSFGDGFAREYLLFIEDLVSGDQLDGDDDYNDVVVHVQAVVASVPEPATLALLGGGLIGLGMFRRRRVA